MLAYVVVPSKNIDKMLLETVKSIKKSNEGLKVVVGFDNGHIDQSVLATITKWGVDIQKSPHSEPSVHSVLNFLLKLFSEEQPIFRLDADDLWVKGRSKQQLNVEENHDAIASNMMYINSKGKSFPNLKYSFESGTFSYPILLFSNVICHPTIFFTGQKLRNWTYPNNFAEDYALWLNWIVEGRTIYYLDKKLIKYRMHASQISRNFKRNEAELFDLYKFWKTAAEFLNVEVLAFDDFMALQCRMFGCEIHEHSFHQIVNHCINLLEFYKEENRINKNYRLRLIQELLIWSLVHKRIFRSILEMKRKGVHIKMIMRVLSRTFFHGLLVKTFTK